ncbi:MAG: hypothetical protein MZU97_11490 [Bacillus subtilis]|nr:hypothetical protein [Bacillus subtilis]
MRVTVFGYAPAEEVSALRYELEPGTYRIATELLAGGRPGEIALLDEAGNVVVCGRMDDAALTSFQVATAGTYFLTITRGKVNGALRITLTAIDPAA